MDDDADLIDGLRAGDAQVLARAWERHRERLLRLARFRLDPRLGGRLDAEDVLQEAFVAARLRADRFAADGFTVPFIWLRLIVLQCLADCHRRHLDAQMRAAGRERSLDAPVQANASTALLARLSGGMSTPSAVLMADERRQQLGRVLGALSENDQEVLALRHGERLSNQEVATVLGIEVKAASIRYVRALKRLQEALASAGGLTTEVRHVR